MLLGLPIAIGASLTALRTAPDRYLAVAALTISLLEAAALVGLVGLGLLARG